MKLISCYIENYGKLKAKEYSFTTGVNMFCQENGTGKSTLASFIKAMFYGLDSYRKDSKEFCERLHFYPFDGGAFGGNLVFEHAGKTYKIERFFGEKSETADTLTLYCNGEETNALGADIGKSVFGIDKASFERTLFISADEIELSSTTAINAKLNNVLQGATEDTNLDSALKRLEATAKEYKKAKAGKDKISEETARIALLREKIENAEKTRAVLYAKMDELDAYDKQIADKEERAVKAQKSNEILGWWEHYETLASGAENKNARLQALKSQYPLGIPTEEESLLVQSFLQKEGNLLAQGKTKAFSAEDELRLAQLSLRFQGGIPDRQTLDNIGAKVENLPVLQKELALLESAQPTDEEKRLAHTFGAYPPAQETLIDTGEKVLKHRAVEREYHALPATVERKRGGKAYIAVAVLATLALILGLALLGAVKSFGIALAVVGGIGLLADGFAYLNGKTQTENSDKNVKMDELRALENAVRAVLLPYGYNSENGLAFDFEMFKKDVQAYGAYAERERAREGERAQKRVYLQNAERELTVFFDGYGVCGETYLKRWNALLTDIESYDDLQRRKQAQTNTTAEIEATIAKNRAGIDAYCGKYRIAEANVQTALEDARECAKIEKEIAEERARAKTYKAEKGLTEKPVQARLDTDSLHEELAVLRAKRSRLALEVEADEAAVELLGEYEADKAEAEERLATFKQKHKLLLATAELLSLAEQNLKDKYVKPIKDEFVNYAGLLEDALGEKVRLSRNFEVSFERNGKERSEKHLSAGQRSICALCFRLALIRNMYKEQTPFLVLDDPFTSLDETHIKRVRTLVQTLSKDMQIIYFVCHESRTL